jgi:hypothetical protein
MDISIFGFKINLEILILIGVIYLILVGHTLCGCCNYSLVETFDLIQGKQPAPAGNSVAKKTSVEGFSGANINYGQSSPYDLNVDKPIDTSSWMGGDLTVTPGQPLNADVQKFMERKQQPLPLPEGEMMFMANSDFKPECCPNTYSNSMGCWCGTSEDYNYLIQRGGNNVPYSEY